MEIIENNRISVVAIIIEDFNSVEKVNAILHEFRDCIIGRLGIPCRDRGINVISVVIDTTQENVNSLSGKLGMTKGVKSKVLTTK